MDVHVPIFVVLKINRSLALVFDHCIGEQEWILTIGGIYLASLLDTLESSFCLKITDPKFSVGFRLVWRIAERCCPGIFAIIEIPIPARKSELFFDPVAILRP